jgi:arabinofuranosyltransferase
MQKSKYVLDAIFYIILIIFTLIYIQKNSQSVADDSYITYRYAQNFIAGDGLVFNVDEHYYGSTAMGFALFLGIITFIAHGIQSLFNIQVNVNIPYIAVVVSGFSVLLIAVCWYKIVKQHNFSIFTWIGSLAFGVYFITALYSSYSPGQETYTYFALLVFSSYLFVFSKKPIASGIVLASSVMTRPDAILFAIIFFSVLTFDFYVFNKGDNKKLKNIIMAAIAFGLIIFSWEVFLYFYFGSWIPGTMTAKKAQVLLGHWKMFNVKDTLSGLNERAFPGFLIVLCFVLGAVTLLTKQSLAKKDFPMGNASKGLLKLCIVWLLFGIGLIAAYASFRVTSWPWYEIPIYFSLLNALISGILILFFNRKIVIRKRIFSALFIIAAIFIAVPTGLKAYKYIDYWRKTPNINLHISSYDPIVDYLHKSEPKGTTIATAEPGALGYKLGPSYKVIDYLGLISPGVANAIIEGDKGFYFKKWKPIYIIISWLGRYTPQDLEWFKENYELVGEFTHPYWQHHLNRGVYLYKIK